LTSERQAQPKFAIDVKEGTVTGPGGTVRLEPKVMDVLRLLSGNAGRVVSRDELMDDVWPDLVVTEHTLSRCVYQLRHQLGKISDNSDQPIIETLPKRGYRLLANVETATARPPHSSASIPSAVPAIPYVIGQWVRGERFYGRAAQIAEILGGPRNCVWLLGTRRIGKTSLLKQLEYIADTSSDQRYFPLFWDFQGAATPSELHMNFADALLDAEERLHRIGIDVSEVETDDLFGSLDRLRRLLRGRNLTLLLLCDEVEELIELQRRDPSLLRKLRRVMQSHADIRTVLASTIRLWALTDQKEDTSPFLHGFAPPLYIERLSDSEAQSLIRQSHLAREHRPEISDGDIETIRRHCNNHPYLMQLVCKRYLESGELDEAIQQVATDRMVSYFFSIDFDMLSDAEQDVIRLIAADPESIPVMVGGDLGLDDDELAGIIGRLRDLGYIHGNQAERFGLANDFFRRWIQAGRDKISAGDSGTTAESSVVSAEAPPVHAAPKTSFFAELKRRKVFQVGGAYVIVAWLLLQLGEVLFDLLDVPGWAGKLLVVLLALGLPLALFLAWAFELTPEGIKRDQDVDRST
jgi:DNA-binding winged helix-turn-helix (wHTH) protein